MMETLPNTSCNTNGHTQNEQSLSDTDPLIINLNATNCSDNNNNNSTNINSNNSKNNNNNNNNNKSNIIKDVVLTNNSDTKDDTSSLSSVNNSVMCRICHCEETSEEFLISPCYCTGTLRFVHQSCLQQWLKSNGTKTCELCKFEFIMQTKIRPFKNWEKLDMNNIERRKILCSVTFHIIAISCVVWSLYVLIERTVEEIKLPRFDWAFWIKLIVVAIGFTGGCVFMYIQCKMYFQLCLRWRQYNRVIIIQPISDEALKNSRKKLFTNSNTSLKNNHYKSKSKQDEAETPTILNMND